MMFDSYIDAIEVEAILHVEHSLGSTLRGALQPMRPVRAIVEQVYTDVMLKRSLCNYPVGTKFFKVIVKNQSITLINWDKQKEVWLVEPHIDMRLD
jgi:hypothetical protein